MSEFVITTEQYSTVVVHMVLRYMLTIHSKLNSRPKLYKDFTKVRNPDRHRLTATSNLEANMTIVTPTFKVFAIIALRFIR